MQLRLPSLSAATLTRAASRSAVHAVVSTTVATAGFVLSSRRWMGVLSPPTSPWGTVQQRFSAVSLARSPSACSSASAQQSRRRGRASLRLVVPPVRERRVPRCSARRRCGRQDEDSGGTRSARAPSVCALAPQHAPALGLRRRVAAQLASGVQWLAPLRCAGSTQ